ncbi:MAG: response regulator [Betaproteobacteria bacterium]|nr:response regulator [Betaproteobacteria bacterium]
MGSVSKTRVGVAQPSSARRPTVLLVDDDPDMHAFFGGVLKQLDERVTLEAFTHAMDAIVWAAGNIADLVFADYIMPQLNGLEFVRRLRVLPGYAQVPVVMVTASEDIGVRYAALDAGMTDFLTKPIDKHECLARSRNLLALRRYQLALESRRRLLEDMVNEATQEVRDRERETLFRLARAGEFRDAETGHHLVRIAHYSRLIADTIGLGSEEAEAIELAAPLHDIGKIGIPDHILLKAGMLDEPEWDMMRTHTLIGHEILKDSASKFVRMGALIALGHHERYDGTGYPHRVAGDHIPLCARIVAVADVFDALTSVRPYKTNWPASQAYDYLLSEAGKKLDPQLVEAFLGIREAVEAVRQRFSDPSGTGLPATSRLST